MSIIRVLFVVAVVSLSFPSAALAQDAQQELRAAIQASVLADPRSGEIPPADMQILVDALVVEAQGNNMTAADILRNSSVSAAATAAAPSCGSGWKSYLCNFNAVFGFSGNDLTIPLAILVLSGLLILVLRRMIHAHKKTMATKPPPWENMPQ